MALYGNTTEEKIWNYFKNKGYTDAGIAGLMGNLQAESALRSTNMQNSFEASKGYTDISYTTAVDNGTYTNFVRDGVGYGLAQWTYYSRKQELLDFAQAQGKSVGDLELQLDFLEKELSTSFKDVQKVLKTTDSVREASTTVLTKFEMPKDMSVKVQDARAAYSQTHYDTQCNSIPVASSTNSDTSSGRISSGDGRSFAAVGTQDMTSSSSESHYAVIAYSSKIRLEPGSISRIKRQTEKMQSESNQAKRKVTTAINGLDWEVASKQNISSRLSKVKKRLDKQEALAAELAHVLVSITDSIIAIDRKYSTKSQNIFNRIKSAIEQKAGRFVDFVFDNKLWKYTSAAGFFLEGAQILNKTVVTPLLEQFKNFNWGTTDVAGSVHVTSSGNISGGSGKSFGDETSANDNTIKDAYREADMVWKQTDYEDYHYGTGKNNNLKDSGCTMFALMNAVHHISGYNFTTEDIKHIRDFAEANGGQYICNKEISTALAKAEGDKYGYTTGTTYTYDGVNTTFETIRNGIDACLDDGGAAYFSVNSSSNTHVVTLVDKRFNPEINEYEYLMLDSYPSNNRLKSQALGNTDGTSAWCTLNSELDIIYRNANGNGTDRKIVTRCGKGVYTLYPA